MRETEHNSMRKDLSQEIEQAYRVLQEARIEAATNIRKILGKLGERMPDAKEIEIADLSTETDGRHLVYSVEQNSLIYRHCITGHRGEIFYSSMERADWGVIPYDPPYVLPEEKLNVWKDPEWWIRYGEKIAEEMQRRIATQEGKK